MFNLSRYFQKAVQPLVFGALDRSPAERRAWLTELRADCPTVALEVERSLRQVLGSTHTSDDDVACCDIVPGSPEHLGLRC